MSREVGRRLRRVLVLPLFLASTLLADSPSKCLDLRGQKAPEEVVAPGIQVVVTARNSCGEDFAGRDVRFRVTIRSKNGGTAGTQNGRFGGTIAAYGTGETRVLVVCDPERAGEIEVALVE